MNFVDVASLSINDNEVMRVTSGNSVLYQWSIDDIPVNPDFELLSASFRSTKVYVGKAASLGISAEKYFNISGAIVIDDQGIIRTKFNRFIVNTTKTDRDNATAVYTALETDVGDRTYTVYLLDGDGNRSANSVSVPITVI